MKLNHFTKRWLNTKAAFLWSVLERSGAGEKVHDEYKRMWPAHRGHPRPVVDEPMKIELTFDEDNDWYAKALEKMRRKK